MRTRNNLYGRTFGRLVAVELQSGAGRSRWLCKCLCGKEKIIYATNLLRGLTRSCGCYCNEVRIKNGTVHGKAKQKVNNAWHGIKARTNNPNCKEYKWYGAIGIKMCQEWMDSFVAFYAYIGDPPSQKHSIDRIDNSKGYEPGNIRWATQKVQCNNKRGNTLVSAYGKVKTLSQWADDTGIPAPTISARIRKLGWSPEEAVSRKASPIFRKYSSASLGVQFHANPNERGN